MFFASFFSSTYHVPDSATPPTSPPAWRDRRTSAYPGGRAPTHTPPTRNPTPPLHLGGDPHTSDPPRHFHIGVPREFRESYLLLPPHRSSAFPLSLGPGLRADFHRDMPIHFRSQYCANTYPFRHFDGPMSAPSLSAMNDYPCESQYFILPALKSPFCILLLGGFHRCPVLCAFLRRPSIRNLIANPFLRNLLNPPFPPNKF